MTQERIDIVISQKGAKEVRRDIEGIGAGAKTAQSSVDLLKRALTVISVGTVAREVVRLSDAYTTINNRLKIATQTSYDLQTVQKSLFDISQRTRSDLATNASLYGRLSIAAKELGADQNRLLKFTEAVGNALAISGGTSESARGSLIQLSQAIGTTIVRAEEFNSILEGAPRIAQAAAAGIDRTGGSVARLRQLVVDGKITSKEFFDAILSQAPKLAEEFGKTTSTIGQAFTRLQNSLTLFVGQSSTVSGGAQTLAVAINLLADNVGILGNALLAIVTVLGVRFVASLVQAGIALVSTAVAAQAASRAAALAAPGMLGLGAAATSASVGATLLSRSLAFFGGPIGLAITGVLILLQNHTNQAAEAQLRYNDSLEKFQPLAVQANSANAQRAQQAREQANTIIQAHIDELTSLNKLIDRYADINSGNLAYRTVGALGMAGREYAGKLGIGDAPSEIMAKADAVRTTIKEMQDLLANPNKNNPAGTGSGAGAAAAGKQVNQALEDQKRLLESIRGPQDTYTRGITAANSLLASGKISTEEYTKAVADLRIAFLDTATDAASGFERGLLKVQKEFADTASLAESAVTNMAKGLEDALVEFSRSGKLSFKSLIDSILTDLTRLSVRQNLTQPLFSALGGGSSGGGLLGSLFQGAGSFLSGGFNNSGQAGLPWQSFGNVNPAGGIYSGFATGTSFTIPGGSAGVDSQMVQFRGSPGERVTVSRQDQQASSGGVPMTINFNFPNSNPESFRQSESQIAASASRAISRAQRNQ